MKFYPDTVVWEITNACNANCIHCGSRSGLPRPDELTEAEALHLCDELHELGCKRVTLIGGEMFLCPYWEKICERLTSHGIHVAPLTNGIMINETTLQKLKNVGVHNVSISLDGLAKTHDYIRGMPGLFDQVMENIKLAKKEGFLVGINTTVTAFNLHEMQALHEFLIENDLKLWQIQIVEDMGNVNENPELQLTVEDVYQLAKYMVEFRQRKIVKILTCHNIGWFTSFEPLLRDHPFTGCVAGRYALGIESDGNLRGCLSIMGDPEANVEGNIRERSLIEIWNDPNSFKAFRDRKVEDLTGFCATCQYNNLCRGGCSSVAYSLIKSFTENPLCLYKYEVENGIKYEE